MTPKIIAIASGKGGVGKTIIAANLARQVVKNSTNRVLVIDGDFGLSSLDILLNVKCLFTIDDFLFREVPLEEVIIPGGKGFDLLPAASGSREVREMSLDQRELFRSSLERISASYDTIFIDCPPGVNRDTLQLCAVSHQTALVVTPDPTSITDTYAFIKLMSEVYKEQHFTIIMNMVRSEEEGFAVYRRLLSVTSDFLGVSLDYAGSLLAHDTIRKSVKERRLFVDVSLPDSHRKAFEAINHYVLNRECLPGNWNGGMKALWPLFLNVEGV